MQRKKRRDKENCSNSGGKKQEDHRTEISFRECCLPDIKRFAVASVQKICTGAVTAILQGQRSSSIHYEAPIPNRGGATALRWNLMSTSADKFDPQAIVVDWLDACRTGELDALLNLYDDRATLECDCEGVSLDRAQLNRRINEVVRETVGACSRRRCAGPGRALRKGDAMKGIESPARFDVDCDGEE